MKPEYPKWFKELCTSMLLSPPDIKTKTDENGVKHVIIPEPAYIDEGMYYTRDELKQMLDE